MYMFIYFNYPPTQQNKDWKIKGDICILEQSVPEDPESQHVCWAPALSFQASMIPYWCNCSVGLDIYLSNGRDTEKERNIWIWGWALLRCRGGETAGYHAPGWACSLCTVLIDVQLCATPHNLSRILWYTLVPWLPGLADIILLDICYEDGLNKVVTNQNFTRANKVPGGLIPPFVHHNFLLSFVTQ